MTPVLQIIGILESKLASGRRTRVGPVSIKTDETGKVRIEPAKRKKSVSQHIKDRKSPKRKWKGAQRP